MNWDMTFDIIFPIKLIEFNFQPLILLGVGFT